jgi:hypothetical protein
MAKGTLFFEEEPSMVTARLVLQSIRSWSYLGATTLVAGLAVAACGGKVVVDGGGSGEGGAGGTTVSSASLLPSTGSSTQNVCDAAIVHINECIPQPMPIPPIPDCSGMVACQLACILSASCAALLGNDPVASKMFTDCITPCG